jgi:integrase
VSSCLKWAVKKRLVPRNEAQLVDNRPIGEEKDNETVREQCWTAQDAQKFLQTAATFGPQPAAFYALALDAGMRKGELCGLQWSSVDLKAQKVRVVRQLVKPGKVPRFGPPKRNKSRTVSLSGETVRLLNRHRKHQAELKMANRSTYHDQGLVFAKEWQDITRNWFSLGSPLQSNNIGQREFKKIMEAAEVPIITFHGMRHTCGTLMLQAGVPVKVVSERLGHKDVETTMNIYQHVLPDMQENAAEKIGSILFG